MSTKTLWCNVVDYEPSHFNAIVEIMRTCLDEHWSPEMVSRIIGMPGIRCKVAVKRGTLHGFAFYQVNQGFAEIKTLLVNEPCRRRHIGRQLLSGILLSLTDSIAMTSVCLADNEAGMAFLRANGFKARRINRSAYDGRDTFTMVWKIKFNECG